MGFETGALLAKPVFIGVMVCGQAGEVAAAIVTGFFTGLFSAVAGEALARDAVGVDGAPAPEAVAVAAWVFLCNDLWTTGVPSDATVFCARGVAAAGVEMTVTSPSAWTEVPHPRTTRAIAVRYRQLRAVIATVFFSRRLGFLIIRGAHPFSDNNAAY